MKNRNLGPALFLIGIGLVLMLLSVLSGCAPDAPVKPDPAPSAVPAETVTPQPTAAPVPTPDPTPSPGQRAKERLMQMTTPEKVGQLLTVGVEGTIPGRDAMSYIQTYQVGGVILFSRNVESADQLLTMTNGLKYLNQEEGNVPLLISADEEGGTVSRMPPEVAVLPDALTSVELGIDSADRGAALAACCKAFGIGMNYAPVLDIWSNPGNTVIGHRAFGTDPYTVNREGQRCMEAMMEGGVIPVIKHFPGHGDTIVDSHVGLPRIAKDLEVLEACEFIPFRTAITTGAPAVMVGHLAITWMDQTYPASLSPAAVTQLLREEMGFDGVVVTDDLTMGAITQYWTVGEAAVKAVQAGCDQLLVCHGRENVDAAREGLLNAVQNGTITEERLNESVLRILTMKETWNVSDDPISGVDIEALNASIAPALIR